MARRSPVRVSGEDDAGEKRIRGSDPLIWNDVEGMISGDNGHVSVAVPESDHEKWWEAR